MTDGGVPTRTAMTPAEYFQLHYKPLQRYIHRHIGDRQQAEELAADCILLACRDGDVVTRCRAWLYRTAHNKIIDTHRARRRAHRRTEALITHMKISAGESLTTLNRLVVREAMHQLSAGDRDVLYLRHWLGCTHAEVAETLGISVGAASNQARRAQQRLLAMLIDDEDASPRLHRSMV